MMMLLALLVLLPLSFMLWLSNALFFSGTDTNGIIEPPTPWRWLFASLMPLLIMRYGLRKKSLSTSGAVAGVLIGFLLTISNYCFFASLLAFFITASKATKFRDYKKRRFEEDFKEGGQRNWVQVLCNGVIAAELGFFFIMETGCWEPPINFSRHYNISWLCMSVLGAISCSCGDTYASEIGSVMGQSEPYLITTLKRVPKGTNGGVSFFGLLASLFGGFVIGVAYYIALLLTCSEEALENSPPQWPIIIAGSLAGFVGSLVDSVLGATLQFSGYDTVKQTIVEKPGEKVQPISGCPFLCNHSVNLLSAFITSMVTPRMAMSLWKNLT